MDYEDFANRIQRITEGIRKDNPSLSVIKQYPSESYRVMQHRADILKERNILHCERSGLIVIVRTFLESGGYTAHIVPICPQGWAPADVARNGTQGNGHTRRNLVPTLQIPAIATVTGRAMETEKIIPGGALDEQ
jgi:hypothetical protein